MDRIGPLADAHLRIDRAEEHLTDVVSGIDSYFHAQPGPVLARVEGNRMTLHGVPDEPPPRMLAVHIGETIQNLRTSLDYLVYALAWFDAGPDPKRKTQFPIEDRPEDFQRKRNSWLKGVSDDHVTAVEGLQPYSGGDWLARLRDLSNLDKHNVLTLAAGVGSSGMVAFGGTDEHAKTFGGFRMPGDEVGVYFPTSPRITFADGTPVVQLLELLVAETRSMLQAFEPEFKGWEIKAQSPGFTEVFRVQLFPNP